MSGKWRRDRWFILGVLFLSVNAYGVFSLVRSGRDRNEIAVAFSPGDERALRPAEELVWKFSEPMAAAEKVGRSAPEGTVVFDPPAEGSFTWTAPDTLTFSPRADWKKCSAFTARLDDALASPAGKTTFAPRIFLFRTEPLRLLSVTQANFTADRRATLRFEFNDAVSPSALVSALSIKNERGRSLDFVALGGLDSNVLLVQVNDADTDRLALRVRKELSGVSGPLGLEKEAVESFAVGTTMALIGLEPSSRSFSGGSIKAIFTAPPALPEASRFIAIDPPVDVVLAPLDYWWDKAGCAIEGDFQPARTYTVTFKKGLPAQNGFTLAADITRTVYFPDRPPALSFGVGGNYLSTRGNLLIPVNSVNLRSFKLKANRIFPNNLVPFALRELKGDYGYYSRPDRDLSRSFPERKYSVAGADNQAVETLLDLRPYLADSPSGAFYLTLEAEGSETPSHLAVVTDTAISAKVSPRDLLVWANSIHTLDPVAEAEVKVYSRANQELLSGKTDRGGIARFRRDGEPPGEEPFLVTVRKGEDISYLCLKGTEVDAARDFEGRPYLREGYEAYLFSDRGIYRPGETAHLTAIVRGKGVSCPPSFPVQLKAIGPLGKTEATISGVLDGFGMTFFDLPFPAYFLTGHYRLLLSIPGDEDDGGELGATEIALEEFVPPQIEVEVASDEGRADARESISFSISARHLFGRPAAEAPVTAWAEFLDEAFAPSGWEGWVFGDPEKKVLPPSQNLGNSRLNEEGRGEIVVPVSEGWRPNGALKVVFGCSVMETGGRSVAAYASRSLDVYPFYLGLKLPPAEGYRRIGEEIPVAAAAVRPDGAPETAAAEVELALNRVFWSTVLKKNAEGVYSYASERQVSPVSRQTVALSAGRGEAAVTPGEAGEYLLTVRDPASGSSSSTSFFAAGPDQEWLAWSLESPEKVELALDRESYLPGDTAVLLIKSPFPGKALLSIESDRVLETRILILDKNTAEAKIPVLPEFAPNVYCSVSVIRPVKAGEKWAGHRAAGVVPLSVASPDRRLNLALSAPETIRPREKLSVRLFLTDSRGDPRAGEAVLLAVDEGICLLTDFPAPDPFSFFFGQRRQEVELCDLYALLMPETEGKIASGPSAPGGDGEMGAALRRRLNPVTARRFQPVALVSGPVAVGEDGEAEISFSVPEFTGRLRLMAVALDQQGFGAAVGAATVKRPLVVKSSLPRFLAPEDRCLLPVEIFNETGVEGEVRVEVEGRSGIVVEAPDGKETTSAQTLRLPAGKSGTVSFRLSAPNHTGAAGVVLRAMLGGEKYEESFEIPVRPASGLVSTSGAGQVKPGGDQKIDLPVDYLAGTGRYDFRSSGHPVLKLGGGLDYLLSYPYGCIEQTVSGSFPLLYLSDLAGEIRPGSLGPAEVEHYVQAGILRVLSMQVAGGGFSFWPAGRDLYDWGSVYAAHFLVEAARAGYDVPRDRREAALAYLQSLLSRAAESPGDVSTPAWRDQMHLKSYAGLVLALAGKPETGWIARLAEEKDYLDPSSRLNVAAALLATGRREEAIALLGVPGAIPEAARELGGGLRSRTRDDAVLLSLRLDLDPKDPSVPVLAARLETAARGGTWATTQENALALMALGKYCRFFAGTAKKIDGSVKGFSGEDAVVTKDHPFHQTFDGVPAGPIRLTNRGEGNLYYYWRAEGVPPRPAEGESDRGIAARRKFKDLSLHEIDPAVLRQGDLVVVELVLDAGDEYLDNVAIEDLLPAGLEIENPDLKTSRLVAGIDEKTTLPIRYSDVRDDRMIVFTGGFTGRKSYFYAARAVTAGEFVYPALSASCMYDPSIRSVNGRGTVRVE